MTNIEKYYQILDLEPGDSAENIKQAHRDLAFIWHPDRCPQNSRIRSKAEEKLKSINEAYEYLSLYDAVVQATPVTSQSKPKSKSQPQSATYGSYRRETSSRHNVNSNSDRDRSVNYDANHRPPQDINVWLY